MITLWNDREMNFTDVRVLKGTLNRSKWEQEAIIPNVSSHNVGNQKFFKAREDKSVNVKLLANKVFTGIDFDNVLVSVYEKLVSLTGNVEQNFDEESNWDKILLAAH